MKDSVAETINGNLIMKMYLNSEQTAKLIELGFEKPRLLYFGNKTIVDYAYTIGELIEFCPRVISSDKFDYATINIFHDTINWVIGYVDGNDIMRFITSDIELIDALCTMCRKLKVGGVI